MEPPPFAIHNSHNSKKRVYTGSSSGGTSIMDAEVIEIPPPVYSKSKALKQKAVICHDVIDIDKDDDSDDLMIIDVKAVSDTKGKNVMPSFHGTPVSAAANGFQLSESDSKSHNISAPGNFSSDFPSIEELDLDMRSDDEYALLQAHFDSIDIPTGVEATIPWWPLSLESKEQATSAGSSLFANVQSLDAGMQKMDPSQPLRFDEPLQAIKSASKYFHGKGKPFSSTSSSFGLHMQPGGTIFPPGTQSPGWTGYGNFPAANPLSSMQQMKPVDAFQAFIGWQDAFLGGNMKSSMIQSVDKSGPVPFKASYMSHFPHPSTRVDDQIVSEISLPSDLVSPRQGDTIEVHILKKLEHFKKFDTMLDHSDHHYANKKESSMKPSKSWVKKIQEEWKILERDLPDTIFVRVYETRMDLLRAVIVGAEGTPYHDGIFFFDVYFPYSYPSVPPHVYYHSGGLRLNPNLYNCGKVCLSLLNTWGGGKEEKWIPAVSTMLQVLVSIQGLILNSQPYFNEPGYASSKGSKHGEMRSKEYNENTFLLSLKTMLYSMRRPPKHFEDFVFGHFFKHAHDILLACRTYMSGAEVGSIVKKGGVQNIQGNESCSEPFKKKLQWQVNTLVQAFGKIGIKDLEKYSIPLDGGDKGIAALGHQNTKKGIDF
ncbi:ubiquitin-conjugating enzyme [Ancistrocladus abbreviatus]